MAAQLSGKTHHSYTRFWQSFYYSSTFIFPLKFLWSSRQNDQWLALASQIFSSFKHVYVKSSVQFWARHAVQYSLKAFKVSVERPNTLQLCGAWLLLQSLVLNFAILWDPKPAFHQMSFKMPVGGKTWPTLIFTSSLQRRDQYNTNTKSNTNTDFFLLLIAELTLSLNLRSLSWSTTDLASYIIDNPVIVTKNL